MPRRPRSRSSLTFAALLGALAALLVPPATAGAAETASLSPALAKLAAPQVAGRPVAGQEAALSLPRSGPGSLVRIDGSVVVEAHFDGGAIAAIPAVKEAGAGVIDASRRFQALALKVDPEDLDELAAVPGVVALTAALAPQVAAVGGGNTAAIQSNGLCEGGSVITQGLGQLKVDLARNAFGTRGAGRRSRSSPTPSTRRPSRAVGRSPPTPTRTNSATTFPARRAPAAARATRSR